MELDLSNHSSQNGFNSSIFFLEDGFYGFEYLEDIMNKITTND